MRFKYGLIIGLNLLIYLSVSLGIVFLASYIRGVSLQEDYTPLVTALVVGTGVGIFMGYQRVRKAMGYGYVVEEKKMLPANPAKRKKKKH